MPTKKILSVILAFVMLAGCIPHSLVFATEEQRQRVAYLHAQGPNPTETNEVSTVFKDETTDVYFAVDNPNKGLYENGVHKEPQYDMNGYTLTIYFDPMYFDYATDPAAAIDYKIPGTTFDTSETGSEETGSGTVTVPTEVGYYVYWRGNGSKLINGKTYKSAGITVFFSGGYVPQKQDDPTKEGYQLWYNLCKLPLTPLKTGSTQVFFDTDGAENERLELFAKNQSEDLSDQTFTYTAINGGYHTIIIKDKSKPSVPVATPSAGTYTEAQTVTLTAEADCDIYYSADGVNFIQYTSPIAVETTTAISCYAVRKTNAEQKSNTVRYSYQILPKAPYLFADKSGTKELIPNIYNENDRFTVYVSDKNVFEPIDGSIYYTFSDLDESGVPTDGMPAGNDPQTEWVLLSNATPQLTVTQKTTVRLVTVRAGEKSEVATYYLGIKPAKAEADHPSGTYPEKIDVALSAKTTGADIYYTLDGSDPITNGELYTGVLTIAKDKTLRCVAYYDGIYSEVSTYYYLFTGYDDMGVDAFYPPGRYEGSVNVTLTPNNPENSVEYSINGGVDWLPYDETLVVDKDTTILARAVDKNHNYGTTYTFQYKIYPLPPRFAPESTQFTNADEVTVFCVESKEETTDRFSLLYTTDGSDPITSASRVQANPLSDSAIIKITKYTVIKAVVLKDGEAYSNVVTHSYDIVTQKPSRPLMTLKPGKYIRKIGDDVSFFTQFMPVPNGTKIYYSISYGGAFMADPMPNMSGTIEYDDKPIEVKGHTIIKAVAVNQFGVKSDVGIFEYIVAPEAPKAAPSASVSGSRLPLVPVSAVKGSLVSYEINGVLNTFTCTDGIFYLDTQTGNAYRDKERTDLLGTEHIGDLTSPAILNIYAELDGVQSEQNRYTYSLSGSSDTLAPPYADKETGEYEEIKADDENYLLHISLYSLNTDGIIQYKTDNGTNWTDYDGNPIRIKDDTILQIRCKKGETYSTTVSYVYQFVPLAPIITLSSGRYSKSTTHTTQIRYDDRAPSDKVDKDYLIKYRENGDQQDSLYGMGVEHEIDHTMSFKAYVVNTKTGRNSKNTIHYYIIEQDSAASGSVHIASPYNVPRISADLLGTGEYANGIKLFSQNTNAKIHYFYSYTQLDSDDSIGTKNLVYDTPIMVNPSMTSITITAWLEDESGHIADSDSTYKIEFVHLLVPQTSLGSERVEFAKGQKYTLLNDYPNDETILLYYTTDGSDPTVNGTLYADEELTLTGAVTVKTVYLSACGTCVSCKAGDYADCWYKIYGKTGTYHYTIPTVISGGGGGGGRRVVDNTRQYTKDIFGNANPTHIGYINGYPDGSVKPEGAITREEVTAVLYRITNHDYEQPFSATGDAFPDIATDRWSVHDVEYMAKQEIVTGYPDGEFKPTGNLTRAEFAALICRFAKLESVQAENPFNDVAKDHWAFENILSLNVSGYMQGYEDGTFKPESEITRAEVMKVMNKILGRNPSDSYVKSLDFNPYIDLEKSKWYYTDVLEATVTHNYYLDSTGLEIKWEDWK